MYKNKTVRASCGNFSPFSTVCVSRGIDVTVVGWLYCGWRKKPPSQWEWTRVRGRDRLVCEVAVLTETFRSKSILEGVETLRLFWDIKRQYFSILYFFSAFLPIALPFYLSLCLCLSECLVIITCNSS